MGIARYLSKLASGLSPEGVLPASKGGTGTTTGGGGGSGGPKITNIQVTDSSYNVLDDTAVDIAGGYIKISGSGFVTGCQVLINTTTATSVTFVSSSEVRAQVPATAAGTYIVYLVNSDGGVAIRVNGVTFSTTPTWTSSSPISAEIGSSLSLQLAAAGATTFSVASGSTLPSGLTLTSGGLLSGSTSALTADVTYNFTILATDSELQDSPKAFAFSVFVASDPYFYYNTLLLSANGTNNATNNTFLDSSTNNLTVTRTGNTAQGTFSPYGVNWSTYIPSAGQTYINAGNNAALALGSGNFTVEAWIYLNSLAPSYTVVMDWRTNGSAGSGIPVIGDLSNTGRLSFAVGNGGGFDSLVTANIATPTNSWFHLAVVRNGTTVTMYYNGASVGSGSIFGTLGIESFNIGNPQTTNYTPQMHISNVRLVKGTAVYTSSFTPSTTPLTAISGTSLLTCQSNSFKDNSVNNFTITKIGNISVQRFSPFIPSSTYSASTIGGSAYFDGTGDYLSLSNITTSGNFTIECWFYQIYKPATYSPIISSTTGTYNFPIILDYNGSGFASGQVGFYLPSTAKANSSATFQMNTWNHIALVRNGSTFTMYLNGVSVCSTTATDNVSVNTIGGWSPSSYFFVGYLSDVRIVNGTAVYTTNFTPPTTPLTAVQNTALLCNFTNAGIFDATMQNNLETAGDAKISTITSKFGNSSLYFDGTGDCLLAPSSPSFDFGTGNFTIEMWINFTNVSSTWQAVISRAYTLTGGWRLYKNNANNQLLWYATTTPLITTTGSPLANNTWSHVAVVRNSGMTSIYIDGVSRGSATDSNNYNPGNYAVEIGKGVVTSEFPVTGYIDDLRITKGLARYTANFTPPTEAHLTK